MENIFIDGMIVKRPSEKAPDFIKANISVNAERFIEFLNTYKNVKGWLDIDLKKSKEGKLYLTLNQFKPRQKDETSEDKLRTQSYVESKVEDEDIIKAEDIPF